MKRKLILVILSTVLLPFSCRYQPELVDYSSLYSDTTLFTDWATLFDAYWHKMSTNYLFWSIDDRDGTWWDGIYYEYKPKFEALGAIETSADTEKSQQAFRYFFDICKNLTDCHYNLGIDLDQTTSGVDYAFSGYTYNILRNLYGDDGKPLSLDDDAIFRIISANDKSSAEYQTYLNYCKERAAAIAYYSISGMDEHVKSTDGARFDESFETLTIGEMTYFQFMNEQAALCGALGYLEDGILYFSFSDYAFEMHKEESAAIVDQFRQLVTSKQTKGIIIDIRGNSGGHEFDIPRLFSIFMNGEDITIGHFRQKGGDNRTDYTPWTPFTIKCDKSVHQTYGDFNRSIPITLLTNHASASCSEITTLLFASLRDKKGCNVRLIGDHGAGAFGWLIDSPFNENTLNSGATYNIGQIARIYTPNIQLSYTDGVCYEGKGYPVDQEVRFNYAEFTAPSGTVGDYSSDKRLQAALDWLKNQ